MKNPLLRLAAWLLTALAGFAAFSAENTALPKRDVVEVSAIGPDAHAPGPLCHPSRYGLLTGRYPFRTDMSQWPKQPLIEEGQVTIASLLKSQGYRTAMVGKWHLGIREDGYDKPLPGGPVACDEVDVAKFGHASAGGWRGMKSDAWEGGHRMPFIVRWPGQVKAGTVTDQTICFTDLLATFAEICGAKLPDEAGPDSFSFLPVLEGVQPADKPIRSPIVMHADSAPSMMMIRSGDWKLINGLGSGGFTKPTTVKPKPGEPAVQLYNLRADPAETTNLATQHPDKVKELLAALQATVDRRRSR